MPSLFARIGGELVPLEECDWVLFAACGCPFGVTVAATPDRLINGHLLQGTARAADEDGAWRQMYDTKREIEQAKNRGCRMELMTRKRWAAEVMDRMQVRCPHDGKASGSGKCRKCKHRFRVRQDGTIQTHHLYQGHLRDEEPCAGSRQLPVPGSVKLKEAVGA